MTHAWLHDKVAIITGGAGSLGLAMAELFVHEGAHVLLADHDEAALQQATSRFDRARVAIAVTDVTQADSVKAMARQAIDTFGGIDMLISNAGNIGPIGDLASYPDDGFDQVLAVHVRGAYLCCKHVAPKMRDGGSIVITSSVAGVRADPGPYAYVTAKHAQVGLMRAVAKELAPRNIRVNTLHPGPVANDFQREVEDRLTPVFQRDAGQFFDDVIPLGRHARPEEIARSALYLASPQSSFVTATTLVVDGGMSA